MSDRRFVLTVDALGKLPLPDELWAGSALEAATRIDLCHLSDGAILLRACPTPAPGRCEDPELGPEGICGLTPTNCSGCDSFELTPPDATPEHWIAVGTLDDDSGYTTYDLFCTRECAAAHLAGDTPLTSAVEGVTA